MIIVNEREVIQMMTNEEKFSKGIVIYKTEDDVICELWGRKHQTRRCDLLYE